MNFGWKVFLVVAVCYALVASLSSVFYQGREIKDLSHNERAILFGRATMGTRFSVFFKNLFSSVFSPPVYILAILIMLVYYGAVWLFG